MLTISEKQKQGWLEEFNVVGTLYQVLNEGRESLRTKRATYRCDEVEGIPLDFIIDVELKSRRALPAPLYEMFLRLSAMGQPELLPDAAKVLLGRAWQEWGLGVDGSYKSLYFRTKNDQVRSYLKGRNGSLDTDNGPIFVGA